MAESVPIHRCAGGAAIVYEDLPIPLGVVLVSDDTILQVKNSLSLLEGSPLPSPILHLKRRFVCQHLVHSSVRPTLYQLPYGLSHVPQHFGPEQSR